MITLDQTIAEVASIKDQVATLITSLGDQAIKKMMGTGNSAQFLSSIIYSMDMIFLAFCSSAIWGFLVLVLFAWEPFIFVMA